MGYEVEVRAIDEKCSLRTVSEAQYEDPLTKAGKYYLKCLSCIKQDVYILTGLCQGFSTS